MNVHERHTLVRNRSIKEFSHFVRHICMLASTDKLFRFYSLASVVSIRNPSTLPKLLNDACMKITGPPSVSAEE